MRVRVADWVVKSMDEAVDYSELTFGVAAADELEDLILDSWQKLKVRELGHRFNDKLPEHRRYNIKSLAIFYKLDRSQGMAIVYSLRGGRQRPMSVRTHKSLATRAAREGTDF